MSDASALLIRAPVVGFAVHGRTLFARLADIYPECEILIEDAPQLTQLVCFEPGSFCHKNASCLDVLAKRVVALHDAVGPLFPAAHHLILYWRNRNRRADVGTYRGLGGAMFDLTWAAPPRRLSARWEYTLNPGGWRRLTELCDTWEWKAPPDLFLRSAPNIIPGDDAMRPLTEIRAPKKQARALPLVTVR